MKKQKQEIEYVICHNEEINKDLEEKLYKSYKEEEKIERWGVILLTIVLVLDIVLTCLFFVKDIRWLVGLVSCISVIVELAISILVVYLQQKKINERETIILEDIEEQNQVLQQTSEELDNEQIQML